MLRGLAQGLTVSCYLIAGIIQQYYIKMPLETETRFHRLCPTMPHIINGEAEQYDGVVETLLNRLPTEHDNDWDTCVLWSEEDKNLRKVYLNCNMFKP